MPIVRVGGNAFYSDESNSVIDPALYAQNEAARKPLRKYLDQVLKMSHLAMDGDTEAGLAADRWLGEWARGGALTQVDSQQAGFERKWILSGLTLAYLRNAPHAGWQNRAEIEAWLAQLTRLMMADYQGYDRNSQKNNHVYWAGLVAISMAKINGDVKLRNWGLEKIRYGLRQIDAEGFLPLELDRKERALQYHRVSIEALLMAAVLVRDDGIDLLREEGGALERMAQTLLKGLDHPQDFAAKAGARQNFEIKDSTAWLAVYDFLRPGKPRVAELLRSYPPVWTRALGGDIQKMLPR